MNFLLRNLESHLDESALVEGEQLLEAGAVGVPREVERHLWLIPVADAFRATDLEVEIKVSPSRVLAGTCECDEFRGQGACPHFAAALLLLRRELRRRQEQRPPPRRGHGGATRKLTTNVVLDQIDHADLVAFVREYARRNRSFAIALKTRFAGHVDDMDSKDKFLQLLDSVINIARRPDRGINKRGLQKISKVLAELHGQGETALARRHYADVFSIAQSIIERIPPVLAKVSAPTDDLAREVNRAFGYILQLLAAPAPPDLRQAIWAFAAGEWPKLAYRKHGFDLFFFQLMLTLAEEVPQISTLLDALDQQITRYREEGRPTLPLLLLQWRLFERHGRRAAARRLVEESLPQPDLLLTAVEQALRQDETGYARELIELALRRGVDRAPGRQLKDFLIRIAERSDDVSSLADLLQERFLATFDERSFQQLRDLRPPDWEVRRRTLIDHLQQLPPGAGRREALALLLADEPDPEQLLADLRQAASIDLLRRFDQPLIPQHQEAVFTLYHHLLTEYVEHHLGPKSSRKIRQTLDHLNQIGLSALATRLAREFRDNYPERHTLMEELSPF